MDPRAGELASVAFLLDFERSYGGSRCLEVDVGRSTDESDIEQGVAEVMTFIDEHELSQTEVSRQTTIEFLKDIRLACQGRIETISREEEDDEDHSVEMDGEGEDG